MTFRDELLEAGILIDMGVDGLYCRSADYEAVHSGIDRIVTALGAEIGAIRLQFPPVEPKTAFIRTGYLGSFPDLIGAISSFTGTDRDHVKLLAALEEGEDWTTFLTPSETMLCPATCHPLYPTQTGTLPAGGRVFDIIGWSFRHEPSLDPERMQAFRMHELVYIGEPEAAEQFRDRWLERCLELWSGLGLPVESVVANDPFFGRLGRMLAANQVEESLKFEIVTEVSSPDKLTAIQSSNLHEDHFGKEFEIFTADGEVAHSACLGFGTERETLALFRHHGMVVSDWPEKVRAQLGLD